MGRLCPHTCLRAGVSGLGERWASGPIASLLLAPHRTTQPAASLPQDTYPPSALLGLTRRGSNVNRKMGMNEHVKLVCVNAGNLINDKPELAEKSQSRCRKVSMATTTSSILPRLRRASAVALSWGIHLQRLGQDSHPTPGDRGMRSYDCTAFWGPSPSHSWLSGAQPFPPSALRGTVSSHGFILY